MSTVWFELRTLDGRCISRTHGLGHDGKWRWVTDAIKGDAECDYSDIDVEETEVGAEYITVKGKRYAVISMDFADTPEHHAAMQEREAFNAETEQQAIIFKLRAQVAIMKAEVQHLRRMIEVWRHRADAAEDAFEQVCKFKQAERNDADAD